MAKQNQLVAQISQQLLGELTEDGKRDLTTFRLSQMEAEVYALADQISQRLLQGLLEDQAGQDSSETCPHCHTPLLPQPDRREAKQLGRCDVEWEEPVKRCQRCRRDFFPSSDHAGSPRGGDHQR